MAKIFAFQSFDTEGLDLWDINEFSFDWFLFDNQYIVSPHPDVFVIDWVDPYLDTQSVFLAGTNLQTSFNGTFLTGGTVKEYVAFLYDEPLFSITGFSINATAITDAMFTKSTYDDYQIVARMLSGNDQFILSEESDRAFARAGADKLFGYGGNDVLGGNGGADALFGGIGRDKLYGGTGQDRLFGGGGGDVLFGGNGADLIRGQKGNDILVGGGQADLFVFKRGDGNDVIRDFRHGVDKIKFVGASYNEIDVTRAGDDVLIEWRNVDVRIKTDKAWKFDKSDFVLGSQTTSKLEPLTDVTDDFLF